MKTVFIVLLNMLLFFFLVGIFGNALQVSRGTLIDKVIVGLIFGIFMAMIPSMLKFFKLPVSGGSLLLMGIIVSFVFFFLGMYIFNFIVISPKSSITFGIPFIDPINLPDRTFTLVFLSLVAAFSSIGLQLMEKGK